MATKTDSNTVTAYPLQWAAGWSRTKNPQRARYGDRSLSKARESVTSEVRLLGGVDLVISSNIQLRNDGLPRSGQAQPQDRGVAIYFKYKGKPVSFACDKWGTVEDNLWAINLTVNAMRQINRSGASEMLDRAFAGFDALPAPQGSAWFEILGVDENASRETVVAAWHKAIKEHHPDKGGDEEEFRKCSSAWTSYLAWCDMKKQEA